MDERTLYLKGYKLDCQKIRSEFHKQDYDPEDNYELCYYTPIIDSISETAYKYVGCGVEPDGHDLNLVPSGKGAAHFVSFCDMAFSTLFRIFLLLSLFIAFLVLNLEKSGKRSAKCCKSRKSHAPLSFCILFQCVKIS